MASPKIMKASKGGLLIFAIRILAPEGDATNTVRYGLLEGCRVLRADERFRSPWLRYDYLWVFDKQ